MFKQCMMTMLFVVIGENLICAHSDAVFVEREMAQAIATVHVSEKMTTLEAYTNDMMYLKSFFEGVLEGYGESDYAGLYMPSRFIPSMINKIPEAMKEVQLRLHYTEPVLFMADPIVFVNETLNMSARLDEFDQVYQEALSAAESLEKAWHVFSKYFNDAFAEAARQYMLELVYNSEAFVRSNKMAAGSK